MTPTKKRLWFCIAGLMLATAAVFLLKPNLIPGGEALVQRMRGKATIEDRLQQYGEVARARLRPRFQHAGVPYPPRRLVLVGLKQEKRLEVFAADGSGELRFIRDYAILRASGKPGPKLREGDFQVPEGFYRIESLNPNSAYHLSLRINYPNEFDREQAQREGRDNLGGDIMIHGGNASVGCLAMSDDVAEELFMLAAETGLENIEVILSPLDFCVIQTLSPLQGEQAGELPGWAKTVHERLQRKLAELPAREIHLP